MIPAKTIEELILKHSTLEKDLSSGEIDKKLFAEKSKEYSDVNEIIENGHNSEDVIKITSLILRNEYKRRQSAPGPKISSNAFGKERRYPMTSKFKP